MRTRSLLRAATVACLTLPGLAQAQKAPERQGFWLSIGLGAGSLGCSDCSGRESGVSGALALGGTLNKQLLLGAFMNGWTKSVSGVTLSLSSLTAGVRIYPSVSSGFFLVGGLGLGNVTVEISGVSVSESGTGALLGLGWDVPLGSSISLTPFWNGVGIKYSDGDANFGQIGLSITWP